MRLGASSGEIPTGTQSIAHLSVHLLGSSAFPGHSPYNALAQSQAPGHSCSLPFSIPQLPQLLRRGRQCRGFLADGQQQPEGGCLGGAAPWGAWEEGAGSLLDSKMQLLSPVTN